MLGFRFAYVVINCCDCFITHCISLSFLLRLPCIFEMSNSFAIAINSSIKFVHNIQFAYLILFLIGYSHFLCWKHFGQIRPRFLPSNPQSFLFSICSALLKLLQYDFPHHQSSFFWKNKWSLIENTTMQNNVFVINTEICV